MTVLGCEVSDGMVWDGTGTWICALKTISRLDSFGYSCGSFFKIMDSARLREN